VALVADAARVLKGVIAIQDQSIISVTRARRADKERPAGASPFRVSYVKILT
jgi:hypothetical protein